MRWRPIRGWSRPLSSGGADGGAVHRDARRHGVGAGPPGGEGVGVRIAGHANQALGLGVVGLQLVVLDGPVLDGSLVDGSPVRTEPEVLGAEARELAVGVDAAAPNRRREVVHVAGEGPVALTFVRPKGAGLDQRIGAEEV